VTTKTSVFIATSLDGFIARQDGSIDWLESANSLIPAGEDCGYAAFMASIDMLVMGRKTFELVRTFAAWPYGTTPVIVLSHQALSIPQAMAKTVSCSQETPAALLTRLAAQGARHVYVDGGQTIHSFLQAGLIDQLIITVIPVLIGDGRRLFGPLPHDVRLVHVSTEVYDFGFVQHWYCVARGA
jgi:dihydrofolate reductase